MAFQKGLLLLSLMLALKGVSFNYLQTKYTSSFARFAIHVILGGSYNSTTLN